MTLKLKKLFSKPLNDYGVMTGNFGFQAPSFNGRLFSGLFFNLIIVEISSLWRYNNSMKARFKYRIYPTDLQKKALAQLFGCVRTVWNDALAFCIEYYKKVEKLANESELQKRF
ncbi:MAG TPA: helix-turn-helix domain-containing protein, partial [Candidatus Sericytochromatia bacterium]